MPDRARRKIPCCTITSSFPIRSRALPPPRAARSGPAPLATSNTSRPFNSADRAQCDRPIQLLHRFRQNRSSPPNSRGSAAISNNRSPETIPPRVASAPSTGAGVKSQLPLRLFVRNQHLLARHPHRVERRARLRARSHCAQPVDRHARRISHRIRKPHSRRLPAGQPRQLSQNLPPASGSRSPECNARPACPAPPPANAPPPCPRTSTRFKPVSMNAGIAPFKKSTTILPVGVGFKS